jgi:CRISPR type I-E-associated protein CasB/Cse2
MYMLTKLTRMVKLIRQKSDRTAVDFSAMLDDLIRWNNENQYVQRKWASAIFTNET